MEPPSRTPADLNQPAPLTKRQRSNTALVEKPVSLNNSLDVSGDKPKAATSPQPKRHYSMDEKTPPAFVATYHPSVNAVSEKTTANSAVPLSSAASINSSSDSPVKKKVPKFLRKVVFDPQTMIFDLCTTGDPTDSERLPQLRECLGIPLDELAEPTKKAPNQLNIDVNEIYTVHQWLSPLHIACSNGNLSAVKLLLCLAGHRVNLKDKEGWTALHCACAEGHLDIIRLLGRCQGYQEYENEETEQKVDKDCIFPPDGPICLISRTNEGETPMDLALEEKKGAIQKIMDGISIL